MSATIGPPSSGELCSRRDDESGSLVFDLGGMPLLEQLPGHGFRPQWEKRQRVAPAGSLDATAIAWVGVTS